MTPRSSRFLTALYPRAWRLRYEEEFLAFLREEPATLASIANIVGRALIERDHAFAEGSRIGGRRPFVLVIYAYAAVVAAGFNLFWTVDDTPLGPAMRNHPGWAAAWDTVAIGSLLALATAVFTTFPPWIGMVRFASAHRRRDILHRVAFLPIAIIALIVWLGGATVLGGGHWIPTPWDIAGDWAAPAAWPPLEIRWVLGSVTFLFLSTVFIGGAVSLKQAAELSAQVEATSGHPRLHQIIRCVFAAAVTTMAFGLAIWAVFANRYSPTVFHAHVGGFLNCTPIASCGGSLILLLGSSTFAIRAACGRNLPTWRNIITEP